MADRWTWARGRRLPEGLLQWLRADPWRDRGGDEDEAPAVGDRAFFRPDSLYVEVTAVTQEGVTSRVTGPADGPEVGEERTVSVSDWRGMHDEGTLLSLPEPPRVGEAWTDPGYMLWFVREVSGGEVVFERFDGETARCGLGPDGQPDDGRGWSRVNVDTEGESRESFEGYGEDM